MIDPSIILRGAEWQQDIQQRNMQALQSLGGNLRNAAVKHAATNLLKLETPEQQQEFIKNSRFAPELTDLLAAKQKTALDTQKTLAEIGKITADTGKLRADSAATSQKATIDHNKAINSSLAAAFSGNPAATSFMLDHAKAGGMLDDSTYNSAKQYLAANANNPEAISALVKSLGTAGAENPEQYLMPDANNVNTNATSIANNTLDNATSVGNNIRTTSASIQNNQLDNQTSVANNVRTTSATLAGQQNSFNIAALDRQQQYQLQTGQGKYVEGTDGKGYIQGWDGSMTPALGADGQQISKGTKPPEEIRKEAERITKMDTLLTSIEDILPDATNSYAGAGWDKTAQFFGGAPKGAIATSQLQTLAGQLVSMMPRMEGPQSNYDVQMYREMAGDLANPTLPIARRQAALQTIRELNNKYADQQNVKLPNPSSSPTHGKVYSQTEIESWAKQRGINVNEAIKKIMDNGGRIQK